MRTPLALPSNLQRLATAQLLLVSGQKTAGAVSQRTDIPRTASSSPLPLLRSLLFLCTLRHLALQAIGGVRSQF